MGEQQREKWLNKMIARYGSEEAVRDEMRRRQVVSRQNYKGTGGFRGMPTEQVNEISRQGVMARKAKKDA